MVYIQAGIRLLLLLLSLYGYVCLLSKYVKIEFAPGVLFSCIGSLMFVAGILNIMQEMAWVIWAGGAYFFLQSVKEKRKIKELLGPGTLMLALLGVFFLLLLFRSKLTSYDNFSHWGTVAKVLAQRNYFPNETNKNVFFQSYPLGSACFIYYITKIVGIYPEWLQMWAQAILMSAMAVSIFAFCEKKEHALIAATGVVMMLCSNIEFVDLLVDTLLPLTALSALSFFIYYKADINKKIYYAIPFMVFLVSIKNSGLLFSAYVFTYILLFVKNRKESIKKLILTASAPVAAIFFWKKHLNQAFNHASASGHSMSVDYYLDMVSDKSQEDILLIIQKFTEKIFSLSNPAWAILGVCAIVCVLLWSVRDKKMHMAHEVVIIAVAVYVVYQIGLLAMYVFSMPMYEAKELAAYIRYHKTILIFVSGLLYIAVILALSDGKRNLRTGVYKFTAAAMFVFLMLGMLDPYFYHYEKQNLDNTLEGRLRQRYDSLIEDYRIIPERSYLLLMGNDWDGSGYLNVMSYYLLNPEKVDVESVSNIEPSVIEQYDYIILFEETDEGHAFMVQHMGKDYETVMYLGDNE